VSRVVFLGTPEAAVPTLSALVDTHEVGLVVTQPDRPKGRSGRPVPSEIKKFADSAGLTIIQPGSPEELNDGLGSYGPYDVGVVVAYGRLLQPEILAIPPLGMLNVHFSLLPRWRGAAPVSRALMAGDTMTGVTVIQMDVGLDTGPVLTAQAIDIDSEADLGSLTNGLAGVGARLLIDTLPRYLNGSLHPVDQSDEGMTYASKITAKDRLLNVDATPEEFINQVRGLSPGPGATIGIDGQSHKILKARAADQEVAIGTWEAIEGKFVIGLRGGALEVVVLHPPGRNPQSGPDWVRGRRVVSGSVGQG